MSNRLWTVFVWSVSTGTLTPVLNWLVLGKSDELFWRDVRQGLDKIKHGPEGPFSCLRLLFYFCLLISRKLHDSDTINNSGSWLLLRKTGTKINMGPKAHLAAFCCCCAVRGVSSTNRKISTPLTTLVSK